MKTLLVSEKEHNRMIEHAKLLLKKRDEAKWEICRIALEICYIPPKKGGRYDDKYSITDMAEDIGMNRKTLSCWILDYQAVYLPLKIDDSKLSFSERKKLSGSITRTRMELFNFDKISREKIKDIPREVVEKTFEKYSKRDILALRLEDFIKNLKHHKYCFKKETFKASHRKLIAEYEKELIEVVEALENLK